MRERRYAPPPPRPRPTGLSGVAEANEMQHDTAVQLELAPPPVEAAAGASQRFRRRLSARLSPARRPATGDKLARSAHSAARCSPSVSSVGRLAAGSQQPPIVCSRRAAAGLKLLGRSLSLSLARSLCHYDYSPRECELELRAGPDPFRICIVSAPLRSAGRRTCLLSCDRSRVEIKIRLRSYR